MSQESRQPQRVSRRTFGRGIIAAGAAALAAPAILRGQNLGDKLNIAVIAVGGRGGGNLDSVAGENIVAICDVNSRALEVAAKKHPMAKKFTDFRKVFERPEDFDAVVISTCEHTHAFATMLALRNGKHVYCEKPLTHNVWEARQIREAYAKAQAKAGGKLATQMGVQMHATENLRKVYEVIQAGAIGAIREAHVWVSRAWGLQSEEAAKRNKDIVFVTERPTEEKEPPAYLDWDLWLGPALYRPFNEVYFPGPKWYRWWDFGNGTMSDLGSHWNDLPFWVLKLDAPLTIEARGPDPHPEIAPASMSVTYEYGKRGDLPPVKLTWYQGEDKPELYTSGDIPKWESGMLFVGEKGMILADYSKHLLLPEKDFKEFKYPEPTLPRTSSHHKEWIEACKGGKPALVDFDYAARLTEANHLGNVAFRAGKKLEWDPIKLRATNAPGADRFIKREYRKGWEL